MDESTGQQLVRWRLSRRALLRTAALTTGVAATAVAAIEVPTAPAASADQGSPILAGEQTATSGSTVLFGSGGSFGSLAVTDTAFAELPAYIPAGVVGTQLTPVPGATESCGVFGLGQYGVAGYGAGPGGVGVAAFAGSGGSALSVFGPAIIEGTTTFASNATFQGHTSFTRSGLATVNGSSKAPSSSVTVSGVSLTAGSMVLATCQTDIAGVAVRSAVKDPTHGRITIHLTAAAQQPVAIAWFVLS